MVARVVVVVAPVGVLPLAEASRRAQAAPSSVVVATIRFFIRAGPQSRDRRSTISFGGVSLDGKRQVLLQRRRRQRTRLLWLLQR